MLNSDDRKEVFRRLQKIGAAEPEAVEAAERLGKAPGKARDGKKKKRRKPKPQKNTGSSQSQA